MARDPDYKADRPERVVIVDADDPLTEIRGEFVWLEEHERAVAAARDSAFAEGYDAGLREAADGGMRVRFERRRSLTHRLQAAGLILVALLVLLMLPVVLF